MSVLHAIGHALAVTGAMTWDILWALILGFTLSAAVQAVVRRERIVALLGDDRPRTIATASGLGAASSSCSYAAVALARTLFRKGASFTAAMAFEIASTNLVIELGVILALLLGWQFTAAEFAGGPLMIVLLAVAFRLFLRDRLLTEARAQAERGVAGSMEGHAAMDMSVADRGHRVATAALRARASPRCRTSSSWSGPRSCATSSADCCSPARSRPGCPSRGGSTCSTPATRSPPSCGDRSSARWSAIASFVCSVGNVPLAAVLWDGGISFGGVVAFIFADLLILPILNIYRKYYGTRMMLIHPRQLLRHDGDRRLPRRSASSAQLGLIPAHQRHRHGRQPGSHWNYTTWLNIAFLALAAVLLVRFVRTGGMPMLRMMDAPPDHRPRPPITRVITTSRQPPLSTHPNTTARTNHPDNPVRMPALVGQVRVARPAPNLGIKVHPHASQRMSIRRREQP